MLNVQLLLTGNELMSGDIIDTNSVYIAQELKNLGIELDRKVTVGDNLELLKAELESISQQADIVIVNGGLGPTVDDMTAQALAEMSNKPLTLHPVALQQLQDWCLKRKYKLTEPNMKQAILPQGCGIVYNPLGSAPGFAITHNECLIICTPGVPVELKAMLSDSILANIAQKIPAKLQTVTQKLKVFGIGESGLQKMINESFPDWPASIELGFRAGMPLLEVKLTSRTSTSNELRSQWYQKLQQLLGQHIVCIGEGSMAEVVVAELNTQQKKITTAESCTGGMIASQITNVAGSSMVFEAGFVTYSNKMKSTLVNVSADTLALHGAVSEAVVREMVLGALAISAADYAVSVSGVAGPDGGSDDKPVGTVWLAWGDKNTIYSQQLHIPAGRIYFQKFVSTIALDLIRRLLKGYTDTPRYVIERQPSADKD
ncbi:CinA family nicotinamide mononucleotide deamidase-related protein [Colwelliaceae bacterium BS250]